MVSKSMSSSDWVCLLSEIILLDVNHVFTGTHFFCFFFKLQVWESLAENPAFPSDRDACFRWFAKVCHLSAVDFVYYVEPVSLK